MDRMVEKLVIAVQGETASDRDVWLPVAWTDCARVLCGARNNRSICGILEQDVG